MTKSLKLQRKARKEAAKRLKRKAQRARQNQLRGRLFKPKMSKSGEFKVGVRHWDAFNCTVKFFWIPADVPVKEENIGDLVSFQFLPDGRIRITENGATFLSPLRVQDLDVYYGICYTSWSLESYWQEMHDHRAAVLSKNISPEMKEFLLHRPERHVVVDKNPIKDYARS